MCHVFALSLRLILSVSLGTTPIDYSEVDFLTPPLPIRPYLIQEGYILRFRTSNPKGGCHPKDMSIRKYRPSHTTNPIAATHLQRERADRRRPQHHTHRD
jgi:hypothetical protein